MSECGLFSLFKRLCILTVSFLKTKLPSATSQAQYWILTIPHANFTPYLPPPCSYIVGQLECSNGTGYLHWQLVVYFRKRVRLRGVTDVFGFVHAEPTKSDAALSYVWKADTRVAGTQFELGTRAIRRNNPADWDSIRRHAISGQLGSVPSDIYIRCYNQLRRITADHLQAVAMEREVSCYWGVSGTGKSRRAWNEATFQAYPKDPRSKFWDGYRGEENVVIDEFRGGIDIAHLLRWLDRYPVIIEVKGASTVLRAKKIWITSNLHPRDWYPELDELTKNALLRRMTIVEFTQLNL